MEWSKLKNIILLILALTNLILLGLVGYQEWNAAHYRSNAREDALKVLEKNGIYMDAEILPRDMQMHLATVSRERDKESAVLEPLLGQLSEQNAGGGQVLYLGEKGQAHLRSRGEFDVTFLPGTYPSEGDAAEHAVKTLGLMGIEATVLQVEEEGTAQTVTLLQQWEGQPVVSCQIQAVYEDGVLVLLSGVRLPGTPGIQGELSLSAVTGLLRFLEQFTAAGDVCNQILRIETGYQMISGSSEPASLNPVWYFETDTGAYILDVVTNQLKKL